MAYEDIPSFHIADYVVFSASIVFSLGIGIYHAFHGGQQKTTSEYILGNRKMQILPVAMSLIVSFESSIMMLGFPAETYMYGFQYSFISFSWGIASVFSAFVFVPTLHAANTNSIFELLEARFGSKNIRLLGNILQTIYYVVYMGIVLFGPAISLEAVTGFPVYLSIVLVAIIAMAYTSVGGIKAVVWTDLFQCIVMVTGLLAILIKGTMVVGGVSEVIRRNEETGRMAVNFDPDPRVRLTFWMMSSYFLRFLGVVFNQASFQRISSTPTAKTATLVYFLSGPGFLIFCFMGCMVGFVAYSYFHYKRCDPLASGRLKNPNQIVILLVLELFESLPGMSGLFLAALFSASLSTLSSGMGSVSAIFWEDIVKPRIGPVSEAKATLIAKIAVLGCGTVSIAVSLLVAEVGGSLGEISGTILGAAAAPLTGLCLITVMIPSIHSRAANLGTIISSGISFWLAFGKNTSKHLVPDTRLPPAPTDLCTILNSTIQMSNVSLVEYETAKANVTVVTQVVSGLGYKVLYTLSPFIYNPFIIMLTLILSFLLSVVIARKDTDIVDEKYIVPIVRKLCCSSYLSKYTERKPSYDQMAIVLQKGDDTVIRQTADGVETIELEVQPNSKDEEGISNKQIHPQNNIDPPP